MGNNPIKRTISEVFEEMAQAIETGMIGKKTRVGLTIIGSEHGPQELVRGAELAMEQNPDLEVVIIGDGGATSLEIVSAGDEKEAQAVMEEMLAQGGLDAAVTMHYNFPIGVSTVGRVITPSKGKSMFVATTTGIAATERVTAMLRNTVYGIAAAKACQIPNPTVGILNIDGARQVERALQKLKEGGYPINFAESLRADGGIIMRGNDLLIGVPDIMVMDSLTGNLIMKVFSASGTGGNYEASGWGYGPGVGEDYDRIIGIVSRASGAPVIAGALKYAADCAKGNLPARIKAEWAAVKAAGWDKLLESLSCPALPMKRAEEAVPPAKKPVTESLPGVEVIELEDAVQVLWKANIYAECGMGCTGPIVMIAPEDKEKAFGLLKEKGYL
ncbi:fatty acid/phospholipid biosynthesis enzyme [Desulfosporosinus orientis DSM 765]|uniref:Fatty acid/phospholipid biosynthesis enzyme n=1 Tax=Desulfosporosinus orientis (strain ATCC 19365 / DSM 765 / NCIMB 8382 / VKM B-1628 / Singapore I) TaxID=768706 RepID=G7WBH4_DESOD|nr:glycine/sarcosine/betaine reductase complex component C subunit alpha [Desulfosporosinus orientis]AET68303.1 fatty acid/phospholipid biosynthesis enzyme [Desulfosporosinus orientis DSM 765]